MKSKESAATGQSAAALGSGVLRGVPVWAWRLLMRLLHRSEVTRFNAEPIVGVDHVDDIDFVGDGIRAHRLDVIVPRAVDEESRAAPLPVYVYFHGGGWTSGDKRALTKYCASQAVAGMVVVNVNYRMATKFQMGHMLADANAALAWIGANIAGYGGDPRRIVLGGDSAGGQIAALMAATSFQPELARHYDLVPATAPGRLKGVVQHCSAVDFSVHFDRGFILSLNFIRMLLPQRTQQLSRARSEGRHHLLRRAARFLSPIEWLDAGFPPVFVTTSERDYFYRANLNFVACLREHAIPVETLIYDRASVNAQHTWQQNYRYPESQEVYRRLQGFVKRVAALS
ncbi:alpha/beta hydrolase [Parafrigoribacterium soli]|uniref:alpha/beta hydrolase n=1 Tax=Parafrigoribacterium soli TaxID=3144663 RepID=UPI0032EF85AA